MELNNSRDILSKQGATRKARNLVKFIAVTTLLIFISGLYGISTLHKENTALQGQVVSLNIEIKELREQAEANQRKMNQLAETNVSLARELEKMKEDLSKPYIVSRGTDRFADFELTAYDDQGFTASGIKVMPNYTVAVDPNVIPLGSKLYIEVPSRPEYSGIYYAIDTGGVVIGTIIDMHISSHSKALAFGRREGKVKLLSLPPDNWRARLKAGDLY